MTYKVTQALPDDERFGLRSQMRRAAVSITSNIAEAAGRVSPRDGARLLSVASGSASELESQVEIATALGLLDCEPDLLARIAEVKKMLRALIANWTSRRDPNP